MCYDQIYGRLVLFAIREKCAFCNIIGQKKISTMQQAHLAGAIQGVLAYLYFGHYKKIKLLTE
jgi:hypothetical protein